MSGNSCWRQQRACPNFYLNERGFGFTLKAVKASQKLSFKQEAIMLFKKQRES
jgi:hypothetical protein